MLVFIVILICISLMTNEFGKFPYVLGHLVASFLKYLLKSLTRLCLFLLIHRNSLHILGMTPLLLLEACLFVLSVVGFSCVFFF